MKASLLIDLTAFTLVSTEQFLQNPIENQLMTFFTDFGWFTNIEVQTYYSPRFLHKNKAINVNPILIL